MSQPRWLGSLKGVRSLFWVAWLCGVACRSNECIDRASGVDTCELCLAKPISCSASQFVLTWGCHFPPSPSPTRRTCEPLPAGCSSDRSCTCLERSYDAGVNCSPGIGPRCSFDGGTLELYCSPP